MNITFTIPDHLSLDVLASLTAILKAEQCEHVADKEEEREEATAIKIVPLHEGVEAPEEGWIYAGFGPLERPEIGRSHSKDVARYLAGQWDYSGWMGSIQDEIYAVRVGSEIARINGF